MTKKTEKIEYVHVIDKQTRKSVHAVKCSNQPSEKVARGMAINLDSEKYELAISENPTDPFA